MDGKELTAYIEPVFRFCHHHLSNWHDAEDLAGEILLHILDGMGKYEIESPEAWVWRIAHNRYARFIDAGRKSREILSAGELLETEDEPFQPEDETTEELEQIFRYLHTLSSEYRDIFVDYYMGEMPVRQLSQKYSLPETTIKWRLNVGRGRIRERIEEDKMDKVYQRINWNTYGCNGSMNAHQYLQTQIARAICRAAYEKPVTVEEISLCTGIPTIYIEDELPRLVYGDAVRKTGNKYVTDFIIFRLKDRACTETVLEPMVKALADYYEELLWKAQGDRAAGEFYGSEFKMERLGYILVPFLIRQKLEELKNKRLGLANGDFPPRKDGGHGWFIIPETEDESETISPYSIGCNANPTGEGFVYFYWVNKYYDRNVYNNCGTIWLAEHGIPEKCPRGAVPEGLLDEEATVKLLRNNLLRKEGGGYGLNFPCFTRKEFLAFCSRYNGEDTRMDELLCRWILSVHKSFEGFVPKRLHSQINQWISVYCGEIIGHVTEELIRRGRLEKPGDMDGESAKPLTDGVFYVQGDFMPV